MTQMHEESELKAKNVIKLLGIVAGAVVLVFLSLMIPQEYHDAVGIVILLFFGLVFAYHAYQKRREIGMFVLAIPAGLVAIAAELVKLAGNLVAGIIGLAVIGGVIWAFFSFPLPIIAITLVLILLALVSR